MELRDKKVVVVGTGVSGIGSAKLLSEVGADIILYDGNEKIVRAEVEQKVADLNNVEIIIGEMPESVVANADLLVISPGVPIDSPIVKSFEAAGVPAWGEIELAYNYEKGTVYAITGTNGKTTTTTLVGAIMKKYNEKTFVVGNIGISYTGETLKTETDSITVAEISSFQLETTHDFAPVGTAILNITPDHLNRHYTMENYIAVKESITKNQNGKGFCVLNYDDVKLREFGKTISNAVFFSRKTILERGAYLEDGILKYSDGNTVTDVIATSDMKIFGNHNYENAMAAIALTINAGVPVDIIREVIKGFAGVEHRIEFVRELIGVKFYNDSKGTNPDSSIKALEAMSSPTILIAGGYDKNSSFDEFIDAFGDKVKLLVLLGKTAPLIEKAARNHGFDRIETVDSLESAVKVCYHNACSGDAVLLSPACASWDMFKSYEERGELFKKYVNSL